MPSYRDSQFISSQRKVTDKQNAPYVYPRRRVRYVDQREIREDGGFSSSDIGRVSKELDRGFIRNLITKTNRGEEVRRRFNFQFNPSDIVQAVQMRNDIYLGVLQDPAQYAQPLSAVASFGFDILLDRTMEVGTGRNNGSSVNVLGVTNPDEDVYQIGVLSDLQVLYSIIGQGFSNELIAENLEILKNIAKKSAGASITDSAERASTISSIDALTSQNSFESDANVGNNAFLIPMPVRIVFSELFMVDGFITSTTVRFTKFNTNMVPIQASIAITMNALYIGFTKEKTFLTENIYKMQQDAIQDRIDASVKNAQVLKAASESANHFVLCTDHSESWLKELGVIEREDQWWPIIRYALSNYPSDYPGGGFSGLTKKEFKVGFKDAKEQGAKDKILRLFQEGVNFLVSYDWTLEIYGEYPSYIVALAAMKFAQRGSGDPTEYNTSMGLNAKKRGLYRQYSSASSEDEWSDSEGKGIRSDSIRSDEAPSKNLSSTPLLDTSVEIDEVYYIVHFTATITVDSTQRRLEDWAVLRGDRPYFYQSKAADLNWPSNNTGFFTPTFTPPS
jgi:hypothetical protein